MVMWYWSVAILFWQLSIDQIVNVRCKRCGFTKTRLRHPSLPFDSLPYPTRTICRRVRTYVCTLGQSRDNQTKRCWPYSISRGSLPRALCASGSPTIRSFNWQKMSYFIARPANSHDSALTLMIFFTFLTASQDSKSHIFLEHIFLKWNVTLLNKNRYSVGNSSACFNLDQEQQNFITFCRISNFFFSQVSRFSFIRGWQVCIAVSYTFSLPMLSLIS